LLYQRDELFTLAEQLVGLALNDERRVASWRHGDPPVVVAIGGRGSGKTAALRELGTAYGNRAPRARLDIADRRYSDDLPGRLPHDAPLLAMLRDLKWELELRVRHNGRLHFPRLSLALLAIATWLPGSEITLDQARRRLTEVTESVAEIAHNDRDWVKDWARDVMADLSGSMAPFPVSIFVKATVHVFLAKTMNSSHRRTALKWHEDHDPRMPGDGYEVLVTVGRDFHAGGDYRARAEQDLVAAFLADLDAGYRGLARLTRVSSPLVLLDNIDARPVGQRFLRLVLASRVRSGTDPLVIIAAAPRPIPTGQPGGSVREVRLTPLHRPDVLDMLREADPQRMPSELPHLIHRLTGGLPLGVDAITRAVAAAVPADGHQSVGPPLAGPSILDIHVPDAEATAAHILRQLVPDDRWRERLITLAPALSAGEAQTLVKTYLAHDVGLSDAEEMIRVNGWHSSGGPFVADSFVRTLLLHQLGRRQTHPGSTDIHVTLRDHHGGEATGMLTRSEPFRLHHCLAVGETGYVVRRLHDSFAGSDAGPWLDALYLICGAPSGAYPDNRRAIALGGTSTPIERAAEGLGKDQLSRYLSVSRLLHAAWFLTDPLVVPDPEAIDKLADELKFLATQHRSGNGILSQAARAWPQRLRNWQQDPAARMQDE
jgi:hypothetical protein